MNPKHQSTEEAWPFYITIFGVRLCWEIKGPKRANGSSSIAAPLCPNTSPKSFEQTHFFCPLNRQPWSDWAIPLEERCFRPSSEKMYVRGYLTYKKTHRTEGLCLES